MKDVQRKFSVRYFLNLVLVDEEERRYFKQQVNVCSSSLFATFASFFVKEIVLWRKQEKEKDKDKAKSSAKAYAQYTSMPSATKSTDNIGEDASSPGNNSDSPSD